MKSFFQGTISLITIVCFISCGNVETIHEQYEMDSVCNLVVIASNRVDVILKSGDEASLELIHHENDFVHYFCADHTNFVSSIGISKPSQVIVTAPAYRRILLKGKVPVETDGCIAADSLFCSLSSSRIVNLSIDAECIDLIYQTDLCNSSCNISGRTNNIRLTPVGPVGWADISQLHYDSLTELDAPFLKLFHRIKK